MTHEYHDPNGVTYLHVDLSRKEQFVARVQSAATFTSLMVLGFFSAITFAGLKEAYFLPLAAIMLLPCYALTAMWSAVYRVEKLREVLDEHCDEGLPFFIGIKSCLPAPETRAVEYRGERGIYNLSYRSYSAGISVQYCEISEYGLTDIPQTAHLLEFYEPASERTVVETETPTDLYTWAEKTFQENNRQDLLDEWNQYLNSGARVYALSPSVHKPVLTRLLLRIEEKS